MDKDNFAPPGYGICRKCGEQFKRYSTTSKQQICDRCVKPRLTTQKRSRSDFLREKERKAGRARGARIHWNLVAKFKKANKKKAKKLWQKEEE